MHRVVQLVIATAAVAAGIAVGAIAGYVVWAQTNPNRIPIDGVWFSAGPGQGIESTAVLGRIDKDQAPADAAYAADLVDFATIEEVRHVNVGDVFEDGANLVSQTFTFPNANEWYGSQPAALLPRTGEFRIQIGDSDAFVRAVDIFADSSNVASGFRASPTSGYDITVAGRIFYVGVNSSRTIHFGSNETGSVHISVAPNSPITLPTARQLVPTGGATDQVLKLSLIHI